MTLALDSKMQGHARTDVTLHLKDVYFQRSAPLAHVASRLAEPCTFSLQQDTTRVSDWLAILTM